MILEDLIVASEHFRISRVGLITVPNAEVWNSQTLVMQMIRYIAILTLRSRLCLGFLRLEVRSVVLHLISP